MVSANRFLLALVTVIILSACETPLATLPVSKSDHTTKWWGDDTRYARTHYVHVIRDDRAQIKEVYRYYFDDQHRPVLDGEREIRRWEHDPGHIIVYRDGRVVREYDVIVTG
jgi:hypothetical protein